jgi:hypothetical protein
MVHLLLIAFCHFHQINFVDPPESNAGNQADRLSRRHDKPKANTHRACTEQSPTMLHDDAISHLPVIGSPWREIIVDQNKPEANT